MKAPTWTWVVFSEMTTTETCVLFGSQSMLNLCQGLGKPLQSAAKAEEVC